MEFIFPINMILLFFQNSKDDLLPKNIGRDDISGIIEKDNIHLSKYGIFFDRKV